MMERYSRSHRRGALGGGLVAATVLLLGAAPVEAQMEFTFVAVGETAGDDVSLLLGQVSAHRAGLGLMPVFSLQSYTVLVDGGDNTYAVSPGVGLRYRASGGAIQGKVGYSWRPDDEGGGVPFFEGGEAGVTTSVHGDYWGRGAYGLQGIASYNWGSEYLWSRGRGTLRLAELGDGSSIHGGAEAVWQGELQGDETTIGGVTAEGPRYTAIQVGPVLQWNSRNVIGVLGGGWKKVDFKVGDDEGGLFDPEEDSTWYFKAELVFTPR